MRSPGHGMRERILIHVLRRGAHPEAAARLEQQLAAEEQAPARAYPRKAPSDPKRSPGDRPGERHR